MNKLPQEAGKKASPSAGKLEKKLPLAKRGLPRVTPKKPKGTLTGIPIVQYAKRQGKKVQIGV